MASQVEIKKEPEEFSYISNDIPSLSETEQRLHNDTSSTYQRGPSSHQNTSSQTTFHCQNGTSENNVKQETMDGVGDGTESKSEMTLIESGDPEIWDNLETDGHKFVNLANQSCPNQGSFLLEVNKFVKNEPNTLSQDQCENNEFTPVIEKIESDYQSHENVSINGQEIESRREVVCEGRSLKDASSSVTQTDEEGVAANIKVELDVGYILYESTSRETPRMDYSFTEDLDIGQTFDCRRTEHAESISQDVFHEQIEIEIERDEEMEPVNWTECRGHKEKVKRCSVLLRDIGARIRLDTSQKSSCGYMKDLQHRDSTRDRDEPLLEMMKRYRCCVVLTDIGGSINGSTKSSSKVSDVHSCPDCYLAFSCPVSLQKHRTKRHEYRNSALHPTAGQNDNSVQLKSERGHFQNGFAEELPKSSNERDFSNNGNRTENDWISGTTDSGLSEVSSCNGTAKKIRLNDFASTEKKALECAVCKKMFSWKAHLKDHERRHTGEKPFMCEVCGVTFSRRSTLQDHKRIHTGFKPYTCSVCGAGFTKSTNLQRHKRSHSGHRPYSCDVCGAGFSRSGLLHKHKRMHTGEKPFICGTCGKAYSWKFSLDCHKKAHRGEKPHSCELCGKKFSQTCGYSYHKRNICVAVQKSSPQVMAKI